MRRGDKASISLPKIAMLAWRPFLLAGVFAAVVPFACAWFDPSGFVNQLSETRIGHAGAVRFLTVWHIHMGVYLGLAVGVVWMIVAIRRLSTASALSP
jgi:hypothetical protein